MVNVVLVTCMAVAILTIFRGQGSLYGILLFFLGFTPFYATITGATLVKMRFHQSKKAIATIDLNSQLPSSDENSQLEN